MSPPFHLNLVLSLRFLQASLLAPLYRSAPVGTRALPMRFQEVSRVKRPGKKASQEEMQLDREAVKEKNLSRSFVQMAGQLRWEMDAASGEKNILWRRWCQGSAGSEAARVSSRVRSQCAPVCR